MFDYHLKQHDSQTRSGRPAGQHPFDYHLKQHDSQTSNREKRHDTALYCFRWLWTTFTVYRISGSESSRSSHREASSRQMSLDTSTGTRPSFPCQERIGMGRQSYTITSRSSLSIISVWQAYSLRGFRRRYAIAGFSSYIRVGRN